MNAMDILLKPSENKKRGMLGFGAMRLPDVSITTKMADAYMEAGLNYFDTAYIYDGSEAQLKKALTSRHPRSTYMLANKMPPWEVKDHRSCNKLFIESLNRCGVDYFDFYLVHSLDAKNQERAIKADIYGWAAEQKKKGLVKHVGFSFHGTTDLLEQILTDHPEMEFVQLQLNYVDVLRGQAGQWQELAIKYDKPIIAMEPMRGGTLANLPPSAEALLKNYAPNASAASWANRYAATLAGVTCMLSGMSSIEHMKDNIRTFKPHVKPLNDEEMGIVEAVLQELAKVSQIPCTACKYCLADCPQQIDIPSCLNLYNEVKRGDGASWNLEMMYKTIPPANRAEACTGCGICNERCPQKIDIPSAFKDVVETFK